MANCTIEFRVVAHVGTLSTNDRGWSKEINIVAWNDNPPKYDIREWDKDHERMTKGITLTPEEARQLCQDLTDHFEMMDEEGNDGRV